MQGYYTTLGHATVTQLQVDKLPSQEVESRRELLAQLTREPPPKEMWKVGGSTNFMIAAARLGLTVWSCGHVADDEIGEYLLQVLKVCMLHWFRLRTCADC